MTTDYETTAEQVIASLKAEAPRLIQPGYRPTVIRDAALILGRLGTVFQRAGELVELIRVADVKRAARELVHRDPEALVLRALTVERAVTLLTEHARWALAMRSGKTKPCDFPTDYARGVLADAEWIGIPVLSSIIGAPTIRPDGSLLTERGYDPATGLLLASSTDFPPVPSEPTKDQAFAALRALSEPFEQFPFASAPAGAAHLAAILTAVSRHLYACAPGVAFTAPEQGTGKTLLADSVGIIAFGITPAHLPLAQGREEFRKALLAILLAGDPIAMLDNVDREFSSAELANFMTAERYGDRVLGSSRTVKLPARVVVIVTGNNVTLAGDLPRRFIVAELDAGIERPETRTGFRIPNLRAHLHQHRGRLAAAALTVLRAFQIANPPEQARPLGSFEQWSRIVREPLLWLGLADPCETTAKARADDPDRERLGALLEAWRDAFKNAPTRTSEALRAATGSALHTALVEALGGDHRLDGTLLGYYLRTNTRKIVSGMRFERDGRRWRVVETP